ncbi:hypothetical protein [Goodfellowiella coeruleoviolacea]|uniref:hypothetical protein n=1 Tax=Goodfellowiella coeruleoviolacea TaxID=334858 RepID=UPI0020A41F53|nr:hypothetical protein [Goodfellowiella coeruleoviolacea]
MFWPLLVVWSYCNAEPGQVLRRVFALSEPDRPDAPSFAHRPPPECRIEPGERRHSHMVPPPVTARRPWSA